jgi:cell division protein ZapA
VENKITIRIQLGDRDYPVTTSADNEELFRKAGKIINEELKDFRMQYPKFDRQDIFSMVAFFTMIEKLEAEADRNLTETHIAQHFSRLHQLIDSSLS